MPSRTGAEGTASGPLPPAVGRGHRALGWKGASPPHSSVFPGGAFSGTPPPFPWRAAHKMHGLQGRVKGRRR